MQKLFNSQQEQEIISLYKTGLSTIKLSKKYNCSGGAINNVLKRNNINRKSNKEYRRLYTINHDFFETINTEEKAYGLGFLYADGNIRKTKNNQYIIQLKVEDKEIIEKFLKSIGSNMPIGKYKNGSGGNIFGAHLTSEKMFKDLNKHGCVPKKSLILTFPTTVPKNLISHFIRGYFDGDGSVYINKKKGIKTPKTNPISCYTEYLGIGFNGTKELLNKINLNIHIGTVIKEKRRTSNSGYIHSTSKNTVRRFYEYIYKDATIFLTRKKNKFEDFYKKDVQRL